jgi:hypothetical protein
MIFHHKISGGSGLSAIWPQFKEILVGSPHLTRADANRIPIVVQADLETRLNALATGGPFETRALDGKSPARPEDVDFALVDGEADVSRAAVQRALSDPWS